MKAGIWRVFKSTFFNCSSFQFDTNSLISTNGTGELRSLSRSDSTLSAQSMPLSSSSPELLLGLAFNDITGHLKVEIIKGSRFRGPSINRPVDTYVKLSLLSSNGHTLSRAKTSVRRAQPNPIFRESFLFPVSRLFAKMTQVLLQDFFCLLSVGGAFPTVGCDTYLQYLYSKKHETQATDWLA
jgi:C2 domain